ncbi:MAG: 3-oxoacyl-ACP synthase [Planctomycetaceae bacterium]|nr:3-oxoacyl-ACP synthase [Planctomycetaceae bacterium]
MIATSSRRVVITGAGLITPLGNTLQPFWESLINGQSGIVPMTLVPPGVLPTSVAAECQDFTGHIDDFGELDKDQKRAIRKGTKMMCREIQMGVAAAQRALASAGLRSGEYDPEQTGAVFGSDYILTVPGEFADAINHCVGDDQTFDFSRWADDGLPHVTPLWLLKYLPNMPASHVAIYNDLRGPNNSITMREASANLAIGEAYCMIARGAADAIVAGATGTRVHPMRTIHVALQEQLTAEAEDPAAASRPFDLDRTGMVVGEGAAAVVLEELETARRRGVPILGEVIGHASSTVMDRQGVGHRGLAISNVIKQACRCADIEPDAIGHVHAHGIATTQGDVEEARGLRDAFTRVPPVVAAKSYFGNLGAGSGMVELIASTLAFQHGRLFRVLNYQKPDPECPIDVVTNTDVDPGETFININTTPQGQASAVVVRKWTG